MLKGFTRNFKPLEILTQEQVEAIHRATLDVLWQTGVTFHHVKALKLFEKNGCKVDYDEKRVHFPSGLVEECLRKAPSSFRFKARDPRNDLIYGGNTVYFMNMPGMQTIDLDTWEPRVPTRKENYDGVTVLDALDNCHFMDAYSPYFGFEDVPEVMKIPESCAAKIRNSTKVQGTGYSNDCEVFCIQMSQAVGADLVGRCIAAPPLTYYSDAVEAAFRYIEAGFPMQLCAGGVIGATYPATTAGSVVIGNAECMAGIVLTQLVKPGHGNTVASFTLPLNMRTGAPAFGQIGISLFHVVFNQMWRRYGVPIYGNADTPSSSKKIDFQCGYERGINLTINALCGANSMLFFGGLHGELTHHPVQAILDDDIAGMIGRFLEGVTVSDETIALELIEQVGPIPGNYLNTAHTREWWRKEQFVPKVADLQTYPEWMKTGKKDCVDYAKERMEEILATHKVSMPLTASQEEDIERILNEARKYYMDKGLISDAEWAVYMRSLESPNYPNA
jgi:trimethylamine--corrinoid protein Co-methyltransferase